MQAMSSPRKASQDAFHTPELLELMLIEVDMRTLLLSQRVSKYWQELITNSTKLKKKLFLVPATSNELVTLSIAPQPKSSTTLDERPTMAVVSTSSQTSGPPSSVYFAALNPLMFWQGSLLLRTCAWIRGSKTTGRIPQRIALKPSWRQMLIMQPPSFEIIAGDPHTQRTCPAGTTLGEAFDIAHELRASDPGAQGTIPYIKTLATCATSRPFWHTVKREQEIKDEESGGSSSGLKP